ncbi:MAG: hypothetical protein RL222_1314 [Bacteroidota bacterium]
MTKNIFLLLCMLCVCVLSFSKPPKNNNELSPISVPAHHIDTVGYAAELNALIKSYNFCVTDPKNTFDVVVLDSSKNQYPASFPGGNDSLYKLIASRIIYPAKARAYGIQGKVILKFIINENGQICNLSILKQGGYTLSEEAIRVLRTLPTWKPALVEGKPVKSYFVLPVTFNISNKIIK